MVDFHKIKTLRAERGWTQAQLGVIADLTIATISLMENGHKDQISMGTLEKLSKAFKVRPAELMK